LIFLQLYEIDRQKLNFISKFILPLLKSKDREKVLSSFPIENITAEVFNSFKERLCKDFLIPIGQETDSQTITFLASVSEMFNF
jgi:hypothetical protein